jgi:hypothetical protein
MTTGQKIAAGILFSFLAFWAIALGVSMNHDPAADDDPVAEACAAAVGVDDTARLARCIANVGAGVTQDDAGRIGRYGR